MIIDNKPTDDKLQYDINRESAKISALQSGKIGKFEYLRGEEISPSEQRVIEQAKFTYSSLGNAFEKQIKTIEDPGEKTNKSTWRALEEHRKQLVKSSIEKEPLTLLKQK